MRMIAMILCKISSRVWFQCLHSTESKNMVGGEPVGGHVMHPGMVAIPYLKRTRALDSNY